MIPAFALLCLTLGKFYSLFDCLNILHQKVQFVNYEFRVPSVPKVQLVQ